MSLGLAGSNSVSLQPAVRIACTDVAFNVKTKHAVIKRVTDPWASEGQKTKNRQYVRDDALMARLNAATRGVLRQSPSLEASLSAVRSRFAEDAPPEEIAAALDAMRKSWQPFTTIDYPNPEGHGTNRVPVRLLSNNPAEIVTMRRKMQTGPQLTCECCSWRLKTEAECKRDGLPWPPVDADRERYFVSLPGEDMGATWYTYGPDFRLTEKKQVVCNPLTCPYAGAFVPQGKYDAKPCKPETTINCQLGDWGGGELAFVHAESWATAQRFNTALAVVFEACGGNVAGIEVDVCLEYTKAQHVPGGSKTRHPYWIVAIPYGMSETEFRERAIQQRRKLLADVGELARLHGATQQLLGEARMEWRAGALLPEFQPYKMLTEGSTYVSTDEEDRPSPIRLDDEAHTAAVDILVESYGITEEQAEIMARANAADLGGMFWTLGAPPASDEPADEEPPALEGTVEQDPAAAPQEDPESFREGEWEDGPAAPEAEPEGAAQDPEPGSQAEAVPVPGGPVRREQPAVPLMFPEPPDNCYLIQQRFEEIGEGADFTRLCMATWKKVAKVERTLVPSPGTCESPDQLEACQKELLHKAEVWWRKIGYPKHGGQG
jgi:hypothetical protein